MTRDGAGRDAAADPLLAAALAALPFGIWVIGADDRLVFANAATRQVTGIAPAGTPPGMPAAELVRSFAFRGLYGAGDPERLAAEHLAIDHTRPFRRQFRRTDGASFEQLGAPLAGGGYVAAVQEVTGHLAAAQAAQAQARQLEGLLAQLRSGVAAFDPERRVLFSNPAYADLLGLPRGAIPAGTAYETLFGMLSAQGEFANTDAATALEFRRRIDRARPATYRRIRPNGQALQIESQPLPDGGHLVELNDITAMQRAEDEARRRAALLDGVLASLPHGVVVYGADGRVAMVNATHQAILSGAEVAPGEHRDEITRRRAAQGEYGPDAAMMLAVTPEQRTPLQRTRPDGRVLDIRYAPLPDGGTVQVTTDITALHAARAEATNRAAQLQVMLDNMRHGIALYDAGMRLVVSNQLANRLTGLPAESMRPGRHILDLVQEQAARGIFGDQQATERALATALTMDRRMPTQRTLRRPDGTVVEVVTDPTPDGGYVVTFSDVTGRAAAEEAARAQAAMLQVALDSMRHGFILYDAGARVIAANALAADCCGLDPADLAPGRTLEQVLRRQREAGVYGAGEPAEATFRALLALDRRQPYEARRQLPDGRVMEVRSAPTPEGGFVVTLTDITARAQAEARAEQRATVLQTALESMRHGFVLYDAEARLVAANSLGAAYSSLDPADLVPGRTLASLLGQQRAAGAFGPEPEAAARLDRLVTLDRSQPYAYHRSMPDGRVLEVRSAPTAERGFVITLTDITPLARAEAAAVERANLLQTMQDSMRHGIALFGPNRRLIVANRLAPDLAGMPAAEMVAGITPAELARWQLRHGVFGEGPAAEAEALAVARRDRSRSHPVRRRMPDGRVIDSVSDPTPDGGFVITWTDVTAQVAAEAAAAERTATLQAMIDTMHHGVVLFGPDHRFLADNRLARELTGIPDAAVRPGARFADLAQQLLRAGVTGDAAADRRLAELTLQADRTRPLHYTRQAPDGRTIEVFSDPLPDGGFVVTLSDITPLARAEAEAKQRAATQAVMLDVIRHGIALFGPDHRLVAANRLAADLSGMPAGRLVPGMPFGDAVRHQHAAGIFGPGEAGEAIAAMALGADRTQTVRYHRRAPDGRLIEVVSDPTPDGGFALTYSDITALAAAEAAAASRATTLQVALDHMRHGLLIYAPDRRLLAANALAAELSGLAPTDVAPGAGFDDLLRRQHATGQLGPEPEATAVLHRLLGADRARRGRRRRHQPDGRVLEVFTDPTPDGGFVITMADISALARAEAEAQHRAAVLQAMLDNIHHGIALFDAEGRIQAVNPVLLALLDLPEEIMRTGGSFEGFIDYLLARGEYGPGEAGREAAERLKRRDRREPARSTRTRPNGTVLEIVSEPVPGGGFVLALTDVTEDRRIRGELERAKDAAETANKAKSRFLATMSHELRTPLNAVIGFSEAITADPDPVRGKEYVRSIHEAGRHLLSLIDDILDVTRAETVGFATTEGEVEPVPLLEGVVRVMQATAAAAGVAVVQALPATLPPLRADALRLRQVLLNLLSNAVKFTPSGGLVTVSAEPTAEGGLVMRVADSGIGIRPEDIPRAFEPFGQLDSSLARRFPGSGLGLYLSRALAEAQGATLTLDSAPGAGTTAVLRFPKSRLITPLAA